MPLGWCIGMNPVHQSEVGNDSPDDIDSREITFHSFSRADLVLLVISLAVVAALIAISVFNIQ
jgi:hypothetical protein